MNSSSLPEEKNADLLNLLLLQHESESNFVFDRNDALKIEHSILLEEYKMMKSEILQLLQDARQVTNLALTAIGAIIAGIAAVLQMQMRVSPKVLLVLPFIFYFFTCIQLRYVFQALDMGRHLSEKTIPHLHMNLLKSLPSRKQEILDLLSWEMPNRTPLRKRGWPFFFVAAASYAMPFVFSIVLIGLYLWYFSNFRFDNIIENFLLLANGIGILYCGLWAFAAERNR